MKNCKGYGLPELDVSTFSLKMKLTMFFLTVSFFQIQANTSLLKVKEINEDTGIYMQQEISGKVTDSNDQPLPGASIIEKGTSNRVVTDFDGNFKITAASDEILIISYLDFTSQEVTIRGQSTLNIQLLEDVADLDEVVVIGYGKTSRRLVTGAISSVTSVKLNAMHFNNNNSC